MGRPPARPQLRVETRLGVLDSVAAGRAPTPSAPDPLDMGSTRRRGGWARGWAARAHTAVDASTRRPSVVDEACKPLARMRRGAVAGQQRGLRAPGEDVARRGGWTAVRRGGKAGRMETRDSETHRAELLVDSRRRCCGARARVGVCSSGGRDASWGRGREAATEA
jgi:hypothetical protein